MHEEESDSLKDCLTYVARCLLVFLSVTSLSTHYAHADKIDLASSTQFLWGEDLLDDNQITLAQYLRFNFKPDKQKFSVTGYGRFISDLESGSVRDNDLSGRLYYLYLNYAPKDTLLFNMGRQFVHFTAGSAVMDGISVEVRDIGPVGISFSGGADVNYSLVSDHSRLANFFTGIEVFLEQIAGTQLGASYVRKYDDWDLARETFGVNARYYFKTVSPYTEIQYDRLSEAINEAVIGVDIFPISFLALKTEYYHSYPVFDATSIYSVFAVDKYEEILFRAEYSFEDTPLTIAASYVWQLYENDEDAEVFTVGANYYPLSALLINASVNYRDGYGGKLWGGEIYSNYSLNKDIFLSAGIQHDTYRRPDFSDDEDAQRYWLGGSWTFRKNTSVDGRIEYNVNENFERNTLGRVSLDWKL